uniref:Uncharacterized protein n=1 Tax=Solanum tuberosum TaxID=4113 RepID=M1BBY1_SOLTU
MEAKSLCPKSVAKNKHNQVRANNITLIRKTIQHGTAICVEAMSIINHEQKRPHAFSRTHDVISKNTTASLIAEYLPSNNM